MRMLLCASAVMLLMAVNTDAVAAAESAEKVQRGGRLTYSKGGPVEVHRPGYEEPIVFQPGSHGMTLLPGDKVVTGPGAAAEVVVSGENMSGIVRVREQTTMEVPDPRQQKESPGLLQQMWNKARDKVTNAPMDVNITKPNAIAGTSDRYSERKEAYHNANKPREKGGQSMGTMMAR